MKNILLIGAGYHAKRIYIPSLLRLQKIGLVNNICTVDLTNKKDDIEKYLFEKQALHIKTFFIKSNCSSKNNLSKDVEKLLDKIVLQFKISGIIISTEPLAHFP